MEPGNSEDSFSRQELETALRLRLEAGQCDYRKAAARYGRLLHAEPEGSIPNAGEALALALAIAREDASLTLRNYADLLRIFTDLTVYCKVTERTYSAAFGEGKNVPGDTNISIVEDDESVRAATKALLRSAGYCAEAFASAHLFLSSGAVQHSACLVLDLRMPEIDGLELQRRLNAAESTVPIIFISAHDDPPNQRKAIEAGAVEFLRKPFAGAALLTAIETALLRKMPEAFTSSPLHTY